MFKRFTIRRRQSTQTFNVLSLDGTTLSFDLESRSSGADVLEKALEASGVQGEKEFFGLVQPVEDSQLRWLSLKKPLKKQLPGRSPYSVSMRVRMYPRDHQSLNQASTRHMLYLQIKQDMFSGRLQCPSSELLHRIAGLALQSEIGDFTAQRCGFTYVSDFELIPVLTHSTEESISHLHRLNRGRSTEECEIELLDLVQDLPTYGTVSYNVQDGSSQSVSICVSPVGVKVQQRTMEGASFEWDSIEKITTRGREVTFHISATHTLAPYQVQYFCQNSAMANNITQYCQYLLESYCVPVIDAERPKSRLKRWFSSRRSQRRRPLPIRRHFRDSSGNTGVVNGRRASFGGEQSSSAMTTVNANSRLSLRVMSRHDSKLVIYGSGGLASSVSDSAQATPNHHTFKLESHQIDPPGSTPTHQSYSATPPHRGSVTDVEHKSIGSMLQGHAHSNQTTPPVWSASIPVIRTSSMERERRGDSQLCEVDSPTKSMVMLGREHESPQSSGSLNRPKRLSDYQPKKEWYHDDDNLSPQDTRAFREVEFDHAHRASSTTRVETLARGSQHSYQGHDSVNNVYAYRHSSSTEHFDRDEPTNHMKKFQSVDQIGRENRHSSPSKHRHHHHSHRHNHHQHHNGHQHHSDHQHHNDRQHHSRHRSHYRHSHEKDGNISSSPLHQTRSSRSNSDLTVKRKKSSSLPRDMPPGLQEEEGEEPDCMSHYIDRHHLARPGNRGHYRLSLPESSFYDNGNRISRQTNARRSRKSLMNTSLASNGSLSQPNDFGLGGSSSRLGSIASLEYQASFAELSQTDVTSVIDPHTRSFIFEGSQSNSQGTIL